MAVEIGSKELFQVRAPSKTKLNDDLMSQWLRLLRLLSSTRKCLSAVNSFAQLSEHVFCASLSSIMENPRLLEENKITHLINCTSLSLDDAPFRGNVEIISIPDPSSETIIARNLETVKQVLEKVKERNQRAVLACTSGVNRASVLCAAYLMWTRKSSLLSTIGTMSDRMGPILGIESYQRELIKYANDLGKLDPPSTWPSVEEEPNPVAERLMGGWEHPIPELFCDDADYDDPSDIEDDGQGVRSPQQIAEAFYREAIKRYREQQQGVTTRFNIGSECASDGGETDLL